MALSLAPRLADAEFTEMFKFFNDLVSWIQNLFWKQVRAMLLSCVVGVSLCALCVSARCERRRDDVMVENVFRLSGAKRADDVVSLSSARCVCVCLCAIWMWALFCRRLARCRACSSCWSIGRVLIVVGSTNFSGCALLSRRSFGLRACAGDGTNASRFAKLGQNDACQRDFGACDACALARQMSARLASRRPS